MTTLPPPTRPLNILFLHGYTQSGPSFQAKTGALRKTLQKAFPAGITLHYPTAPIRLHPADVPWQLEKDTSAEAEEAEVDAWAWWRRKGDADSGPYTYEGLEEGLSRIADVLRRSGPFDGVVGFSQGGAMAGMVASLLEPGRRSAFEAAYSTGGMQYPSSFEALDHAPLKFAVSYSGFAAQGENPYRAFYEPKIATPVLHFIGSQDVVVLEERSLALVRACVGRGEGDVVYHPGGHFLPSTQKACVNALVGFIKGVVADGEGDGEGKKEEESVEDMDVPF
ncbi:dihydrofolate reductase [Dothidotthia symphoricarpi CBS 119687]|uniref:Dihydrofolate reductase n=1 Tax=Dothidotthia symphoricarpi CBS 119687 TaxID=1392245 RepID=A0A6A6AKM7_9PLEO|nr:dihydrofolate reductase [Dothidotthia symphoricarpi CBS 119687]KAF2132370.1 dihydrofolate reductase [Dothidotthia symphoricarpi CBS 119687]